MQLIKVNSNSAIMRHEWHELNSYLFESSFFSFQLPLLSNFLLSTHRTIIQWEQIQTLEGEKNIASEPKPLKLAICGQFLTCERLARGRVHCISLPINPIHDQSVTAPRYITTNTRVDNL